MTEAGLLFSVIIPTRDRPEALSRCLRALEGTDFPRPRYEVVVVHDGSTAPRVTGGEAPQARHLEQPAAGPAAARNAGARVATGRYLVFLDDDCLPARDWLAAFERRLRREPGAALGGRTENALPQNAFSEATQLLIDYLYTVQAGTSEAFFTSNNLLFPADGFRALGGFDPTFSFAGGEDRDLCARWLARGNDLRFEPGAVVGHAHDLTLRTFVRQHFNYGRGAFGHHRRRAQSPRGPGFYVSLVRFPYAARRGRGRLALCALLALSQLATAGGYAWEAFRRRASWR